MEVTLRPFEIEIIDKFKTFSPITGGGKSIPRKGVWIKGHLLDVSEDYVYGMWKKWRNFAITARFRHASIELGTYTAFRTYIYLLKKYGLVIPTRRERAKTTAREFYRQYYRVNRRKIASPLWRNPYAKYPSWLEWKLKGFPRPKKKPKVPRVIRPPVTWMTPEELDRIWSTAETFLREHGYTITREQLETIIPDWGVEAWKYETFEERVGYVIHEAVEIEEVARMARRWIDPRMAPEPVRLKAHEIAEKMEKEWLS